MKKKKWIYAFGILLMAKNAWLYGQTLSDHEMEIKDQVTQQQEEEIDTLKQLVNINSGTRNFDGIKKVADQLADELQQLNFETRWVPMTQYERAGYLFALHNGGTGKRVLLIGHLDTVFNESSPFQKFKRVDDTAYGPGVEDMKGGIAVMLYALKALQAVGDLDDANIIVVWTGDEEYSGNKFEKLRTPLDAAAKNSDYALSFEGSSNLNEVVTALRGVSYWSLHIRSKGGHSSEIFMPEFGNGAILEIAHILNTFEQQTRNEAGLTFNPGIIAGGFDSVLDPTLNSGRTFGKYDSIAKDERAQGEIRYLSQSQCQSIQQKMIDDMKQASPHTAARIDFSPCKPTMIASKENQSLLLQLDDINQTLGYGSVGQANPMNTGTTDLSFIAALLPSIDGLGAVGQGAHSVNEQIKISDLNAATQRAAILVDRLVNG